MGSLHFPGFHIRTGLKSRSATSLPDHDGRSIRTGLVAHGIAGSGRLPLRFHIMLGGASASHIPLTENGKDMNLSRWNRIDETVLGLIH
jgi:hypothetical protein